jgi:pantothenate kinase
MVEKNINREIISMEIRELFSDIEKFIVKKDEIASNFKKVFLGCSTNN